MQTEKKLIKTYKGFRIYKYSKIHVGDYNKIHENERYCIKKPEKFLFWTYYSDLHLSDGWYYKPLEYYSIGECKEFIDDYISKVHVSHIKSTRDKE